MVYPAQHHRVSEYFLQRLNGREIVFEFFIVFSRFEYALMRSGFINGDHRGVYANWDRFAATEKDNFNPDQTPELQEAVTYFQNRPPRKQIVEEEDLVWINTPRPDNEPLLLTLTVLIRRVRNNLFHGNKISDLLERYSPRNRDLLRYSIVILYSFLDLNSHVRNVFLGELRQELKL